MLRDPKLNPVCWEHFSLPREELWGQAGMLHQLQHPVLKEKATFQLSLGLGCTAWLSLTHRDGSAWQETPPTAPAPSLCCDYPNQFSLKATPAEHPPSTHCSVCSPPAENAAHETVAHLERCLPRTNAACLTLVTAFPRSSRSRPAAPHRGRLWPCSPSGGSAANFPPSGNVATTGRDGEGSAVPFLPAAPREGRFGGAHGGAAVSPDPPRRRTAAGARVHQKRAPCARCSVPEGAAPPPPLHDRARKSDPARVRGNW